MKSYFVFLPLLIFCCLLTLMPLHAQQKKDFYVNSYRRIEPGKRTKLERLCQGFDVVISSNRINVGDQFDLVVIDSNYIPEDSHTLFKVKDPSNAFKIGVAIVGIDSGGDNFIQLHEVDDDGNLIYEGGMVFMHLNSVADYDLWRYLRNNE